MSETAGHLHQALEGADAIADALKPEMALAHAGDGCRVEAAAIVADGKEEPVAIEASGDPDGGGVAMPGGVDGELPDDAEDRVRALVGEAFTRDAKIARVSNRCSAGRSVSATRSAAFRSIVAPVRFCAMESCSSIARRVRSSVFRLASIRVRSEAAIARPRRIICLQPRNIARPRKAVF